jgi:adenine phosphoribosyltransferase
MSDKIRIDGASWISPKDYITEVPDFPIEGIGFKDISPLLANEEMFGDVIVEMRNLIHRVPDYWIGIDARGFIFASALATYCGGGVVMCRKAGKLPPPVESASYALEYDVATLQMKKGKGTAVIVDDVFATGGTLRAVNYLAEKAGYDVQDNLVLIDLLYLPTVEDFNFKVKSLIQYNE